MKVVRYDEPRPAVPDDPEFRLVAADDKGGKGLLAVVPVMRQRGPKPKYQMVSTAQTPRPAGADRAKMPIVSFDGGAFVVETYAKVAVEQYTGPHAGVLFQDGHFVLDSDASDTAVFNHEIGVLIPKTSTAMSARETDTVTVEPSGAKRAPESDTDDPDGGSADHESPSPVPLVNESKQGSPKKRQKRQSHQMARARMAAH